MLESEFDIRFDKEPTKHFYNVRKNYCSPNIISKIKKVSCLPTDRFSIAKKSWSEFSIMISEEIRKILKHLVKIGRALPNFNPISLNWHIYFPLVKWLRVRQVLLVVKLGDFIEIFAVFGVVWCVITAFGYFYELGVSREVIRGNFECVFPSFLLISLILRWQGL